jgi:4-amino-4-deoxy-L-arabinose transferase-like glycosyltransferase
MPLTSARVSAGTVVPEARRPVASAPVAHARSLLAEPAVLALIGLTVLAAVIRFWRIGHQGFWFDEGNTSLLVSFSPGAMLRQLARTESTPPLYYCVAWIWAHVFGRTEVPLRSLSALFGVAAVPVAYAACAKLVSRRAGLIAAALTAFNPLLIWYSQEARAYAMLVFVSGLALLAFAYAREEPSARRLTWWAVVSLAALATHYYAVLAVAPQALWLLRAGFSRREVRVAVGVVAVCGLALVPLAVHQSHQDLTSWIAEAPLGRRVAQVWPQFVLGFSAPACDVLKWVALAGAVAGLAVLVAQRSPPAVASARRGGLAAAGLALAGLVLVLMFVAAVVDDLLTRNLLAIWMPAAIAVAGGLALMRPRLLGPAITAAMCACGIVAAIGVATSRDFERPDWRVVARVIGPRPAPAVAAGGGRAILVQHYRDLLPLSLYVPGIRFMSRRGATVSELDVVSFTTPPSPGFCWWGPWCNLWPSRMQRSYHIRGFHPVWRRHALRFTILRLVPDHPLRLTPHAVSRALHTTHFRNDELLIQR